MPQFFQLPPDPGIQTAINYVNNLQAERFRREQERAQEREAQEQRLIIGASLAAGAVGGFALAPALGATTGLATAGFTLQGAAVGAQIGQQFAGGDIAGGVTTAAGAASGIIQSMDDQQFFGTSLTKQDRSALARQAAKLNTTIPALKKMAAESGQMVPEIMQGLQFEQANDEQLRGMLETAGIPLSPSELRQDAEGNGISVQEQFFAHQGEVSQFRAQSAAEKQYAVTTARTQAELDAGTRNENFEPHFDPRELTQRSADLNAIDQGFANGDFTIEQAKSQKAALPRLMPTMRPRQTLRTIEEEEVISEKTGQIYVRDARNPTGFRHVGSMKDLSGPPRTFEEAMAQLSPQQRMEMANKVRTQLLIEDKRENAPPATPQEVAARMRANFDATNFIGQPQPAAQGAPQGQGRPQPQQPQNPASVATQRVQQNFVTLVNLMSEKPLDTWTEPELDQGGNIVTTMLADLQTFPRGDPQALQMARKVLELKELIDAQRNR